MTFSLRRRFFHAAFLTVLCAAWPAFAEIPAGAVVYGVVPQLFGSERPLRAVTEKLKEIRAQGTDVLWLSPVYETDDPSWISYSVTDYFGLRAELGTPSDLRSLVREAHRLGMRVILDIVPNHASAGHPYYRDAESLGKRSRFFNFFERDAAGNATHYFDWKHLPNLNYANPEVRTLVTRAFQHWITEYEVDGFRVDAAWGVRQRAPEFWPKLERELERLKPGVILIAEASARDPYYFSHGFDAAYDWSAKLGEWAWKDVFSDPARATERLDRALRSERHPERILRFLNNNDTGARFVTRHGPAMTRLASVLQHTLPGVALVYTGDEVGAEFDPYQDPPPISWKDREGLKEHYRRLATLRESVPALRSGMLLLAGPSTDRKSYAYFRVGERDSEQALVVLNFGEPGRVRVRIPKPLERAWTRLPSVDAVTGKRIVARRTGRDIEISLQAREAVVLVAEGESG